MKINKSGLLRIVANSEKTHILQVNAIYVSRIMSNEIDKNLGAAE